MHTVYKGNSQSISSDDEMDMQTPKQLQIPSVNVMPLRYESDEESVSPVPDDFEDARESFSDVEFDSSLDLDDDESPSLLSATSMSLLSARPLLVNVRKLAPMDKRSTAAHVRPQLTTTKMAVSRPVIARAGYGQKSAPAVVTLSKPPTRKAVPGPPPVPMRNEARAHALTEETMASQQRQAFPPRKDSHASRPSISTVASNFDDDRSSIADSSSSSAPSSVADDADIAARNQFLSEEASRKDSIARKHDEELERAMSEYTQWRSEGSPGSPRDQAWHDVAQAELSPTQRMYGDLNGRRLAIGNEEHDEEWRREIEKGLATPTPTSYAAYDPFNVSQPTLKRMSNGGRMSTAKEEIPRPSGPINGMRRGFANMRKNL